MNVVQDRELVALLAEEPELLAIADAVATTQRRRRRLSTRLLPLAAALAALTALVIVAPWGQNGPNVVEDALAALGTGPVLHVIVEYSGDDAIVELSTGRSTPRTHRSEYWYDAERKLLRTRLSTDGVQITEIVESPTHAYSDLGDFDSGPGYVPQLDPALAGFATGYRKALEDGTAREVGKTKIGLRPVTLLSFQRGSGEVVTVAVDDKTRLPLRFSTAYAGGRHSPDWTVVLAESLQRDPALFAHPALAAPRPTSGSGGLARPVDLAAAASALGAKPVWLGSSFRGRPLDSVELTKVTAELTDGRDVDGLVVRVAYDRVRVSMANDLAGAYALGMEDGGDPPPPSGSIAITRPPGGPRPWEGELRLHGLYVSIDAPSEHELIDAARGLRLADVH